METDIRERCVTLHLDMRRNANWSQYVLLMSDLHIDHPWSDRKAILAALDQARERKALVMINGDALCLMQAPGDRRATKGMTMPDHERPDYLDAVVDWFCELMEPYRDLFVLYGSGNHETSIVKHHGTSPARRICQKMGVPYGGYHGFVIFRFSEVRKPRGFSQAIRMYRHHGMGRGGAQTGPALVLRSMRQAADADIYWAGHTHHSMVQPTSVEQVSDMGVVRKHRLLSISTPAWKEEWLKPDGWAVERGMGPRPIGAYWLKFGWKRDGNILTYTAEELT